MPNPRDNWPKDKAPAPGRPKDTGGKAGSGKVDPRPDPNDDKHQEYGHE